MGITYGQNSTPEPTAVFRAVFWDRFTSRDLSFAPWGNGEEANATILSARVGFSQPSRSFVYYGDSPFKVFTKSFVQVDENCNAGKIEQSGGICFSAQENELPKDIYLF